MKDGDMFNLLKFGSSSELDDYVSSNNYTLQANQLCFSLEVLKNDTQNHDY